MKRSLKILSIITILVIGLMLLPIRSYATGAVTPIPTEGETENTAVVTSTETTTTTSETLSEDKIADDKVLPDAGFENNMIFIIAALGVFAVFAYIKVVKYNVD